MLKTGFLCQDMKAKNESKKSHNFDFSVLIHFNSYRREADTKQNLKNVLATEDTVTQRTITQQLSL